MRPDAGVRIAQYHLERRLGTGGMGDVFLAHDDRLDRQVAIKFLTAQSDDQARRRLLREARAVAGVDHQGICSVYEVGSDPDFGDFIAMQYIEGETLASRLRRGRMKPEESLALGGHIAEALVAAHRHGIVHRDLKPQNIMLMPSGAPKLLDFGLATHVPTTTAAANAITSSQISDPNVIVGTPGYMAPEQVRNEPASYRTDVFALGCVLHECLTGQRAFSGATVAEVLGQILHVDPPPVSTLVPELGPVYDALCARLLHKLPEERFQSAEEVLGAIRALTPSARLSATTAATTPTAHKRTNLLGIASLMAGVVIVAIVVVPKILRGPALPEAPADAAVWYTRGVEAMRDGTYIAARTAFQEAVKIFPRYAQAHARLAEAQIALDDDNGAKAALLQVTAIVPDWSRLDQDDRLRFEAARAEALTHHDEAIAKYRELADRQPKDAGRWLDVGRAEELAGKRALARVSYAKAVDLDKQSAAARLRLGILQANTGQTEPGLASLDEAARLYRVASKGEGEAEALLRKGIALGAIAKYDSAREALNRVVQLAADPRYLPQSVQAKFELARLTFIGGQISEAEDMARRAVADAAAANLPGLAATGLIQLGNTLMQNARYALADDQYARSAELASSKNAKRTEMRALLGRASVRVQLDQPEEALEMSVAPLQYFLATDDARQANNAKSIQSRAHEALEHYDEAQKLATEVIAFAEASGDNSLMSTNLENLAGQLTRLGRLPEALARREQLEALNTRLKNQAALPLDLGNRAEILILLGRSDEAKALLDRLEKEIKAGAEFYVGRIPRVRQLRALVATIERQWPDVVRASTDIDAAISKMPKPSKGALTMQLYTHVLAEYAQSQVGRSRTAIATIAGWPAQATSNSERRAVSFWIAQTLVARNEPKLAQQVLTAAMAGPVVEANPELGWRLATVHAGISRRLSDSAAAVAMTTLAKTKADAVTAAWGAAATAYFARPDLAVLLKDVR